jgi:hypothetical protein
MTMVTLLQATREEARSWWTICSVTPSHARAALLHGDALGSAISVSVGNETQSLSLVPGSFPYALVAMPGLNDIVGVRTSPPMRIIARRGVRVEADQALDLDFAAGAVEPLFLPLEISGQVAGETLRGSVRLETENGTSVTLCRSSAAKERCAYLPASEQRASDAYLVNATAGSPTGGPTRSVTRMMRSPRPLRLELPQGRMSAKASADPLSLTFEEWAGALAHRIQLMTFPGTSWGSIVDFSATITPGWRRGERTYLIPDLRGIGGEHVGFSGTDLQWMAAAISTNVPLATYLGKPAAGWVQRAVGTTGSLRVPGKRSSPRSALERELFALAARMRGFLEAGDCESAWRRRHAFYRQNLSVAESGGRRVRDPQGVLGSPEGPSEARCRALEAVLRDVGR